MKLVLCQYCNSENAVGASHCSSCGAPLQAPGVPIGDQGAAFAAVAMPASGLVFTGGVALAIMSMILLGMLEHPSKTARRMQSGADAEVHVGSDDDSGKVLADVFVVIQTGVSALVLLGGIQMFRLQSYRAARLGSVLSMLPLVGPCCGLALPFGLWSIIVLNRPSVRSHFNDEVT